MLQEYHPPLFQNREGKIGGGVLIFVKDSISKFKNVSGLFFDDPFNNVMTTYIFLHTYCFYHRCITLDANYY